jgi:pimeloyl-ACP methyl ester carboxylesterase
MSSLPRIVQQPLPVSRTFAAGEQSVHWLEWPASVALPGTAVLIHAPGQLARLWQPIAARLVGRRRVVAPDLPGHGLSPAGGDVETDIDVLQAWLADVAPDATAIVSVGAGAGIAARLAGDADSLEVCLSPREPTGALDGDVPEQRRRIWPGRWEMFAGLRTPRWFAHWRSDLLWTYVEDGSELLPDGSVRLRCNDASEARFLALGRPLDRLLEVNISPLARPVEAAARLGALLDGPAAD